MKQSDTSSDTGTSREWVGRVWWPGGWAEGHGKRPLRVETSANTVQTLGRQRAATRIWTWRLGWGGAEDEGGDRREGVIATRRGRNELRTFSKAPLDNTCLGEKFVEKFVDRQFREVKDKLKGHDLANFADVQDGAGHEPGKGRGGRDGGDRCVGMEEVSPFPIAQPPVSYRPGQRRSLPKGGHHNGVAALAKRERPRHSRFWGQGGKGAHGDQAGEE